MELSSSDIPPLLRFLLLSLALGLCSEAFTCPKFEGRYRDCTCGIKYRDVEERCCNDETCLEPSLSSENLTCPFVCQNGGSFDDSVKSCNCEPGFFGLCCELETPLCGALLFGPLGQFSSPGYPDRSYPNGVRCLWRISTDPARQIAVGLGKGEGGGMFEVEKGTSEGSCNHDWVAVYDGEERTSRQLGRFCGRTMPTVRSSGRHLLVEFSSDWQQRRRGFQLNYVTFFAAEPCGRGLFSRQSGIIPSPQYPLNYPPDLQCRYSIIVRPQHFVVLSTVELDIPASNDCRHGDKIIISRTRQGKPREPLYVLCGSQLFQPVSIPDSEQVMLDFSSDCLKSDRQSEGRFKIRFEQIPLFPQITIE